MTDEIFSEKCNCYYEEVIFYMQDYKYRKALDLLDDKIVFHHDLYLRYLGMAYKAKIESQMEYYFKSSREHFIKFIGLMELKDTLEKEIES